MTLGATVLGVTIDGYAVEGGYDVEGGPLTSFSVAQSLGRIQASLRSQGTFEHLDELVGRAADVGCRELRLTMEWARVEPRPDVRDLDALGTYVAALRAATRAGMSTAVVLCDAAWPSWLGQEPWLSSWAPERFAAHAGWLADRLDGVAQAIVTFRAPNRTSSDGWCTATRPPYRRGATADAMSALDGMVVAHLLAAESIEEVSPATRRAVIFEASGSYEGEAVWRDLATGIVDPVLLAARRDDYERSVHRTARRGARLPDAAALRSSRRWRDAPACEWWLASDDAELLSATVEHAAGTVTTIELGAGPRGWSSQLATALPLLAGGAVEVRALQLHGLVSSTGPLAGPVGLLDVDQHGGGWQVGHVDDAVATALARFLV
ncbi:MAG TPA: family 1 glycosylhydrolase [Acidimicrobiales bacterium]|nr:family 1 glycosylhydrolase [Acidimicrobiales bacterium]